MGNKMGIQRSVRRSVFLAMTELEALAVSGNDINPIHLADQKILDFQAAGDIDGVKFWRDVWLHLMFQKYSPAELRIVEEAQCPPSTQTVTKTGQTGLPAI
jgi:hypothetical protein